jgi:hypothetical protein
MPTLLCLHKPLHVTLTELRCLRSTSRSESRYMPVLVVYLYMCVMHGLWYVLAAWLKHDGMYYMDMDWLDYGFSFLEPSMWLIWMCNPEHPLMEGYKLTSFYDANRICICLFKCTILGRHDGTSTITPSVSFICINTTYRLAVEP